MASAFDTTMASVRHNVRRLADFSGRDARIQFWPWIGVVTTVMSLLQMVAMAPTIVQTAALMRTVAATHAVKVDLNVDATGAGVAIPEAPIALPDIRGFIVTNMVIVLVAILFMAASVARRLRDRGRSPLWALIPFALLIASGVTTDGLAVPGTDDAAQLPTVMVANLLYLMSAALLVGQLAGPSRIDAG